jgi:tetratricopeptide (TPR) repeat protein
LLEQIAEMPEDAILDAIDEAKAAALVAEVGGEVERYTFTHALVRATLYDDISPARRARMHRRVGAALERLTETRPGQRIDELARHWMAATTIGDSSKAIAYARQAAEQALAGLAFEEAAKYYEQALAALPPDDRDSDPLRCDLLIALSDAQRRAGEADFHRAMTEAVRIARSLGDSRRLAMAVLVSARPGGTLANASVVDHALIALYEEALAGLREEGDDVLRAKLLAQLSAELLYTAEFDRRRRLSGEAVTIARRSGDQSVLAFALYARAVAINVPTALAERLALIAEMEALAERSGSIETRWSVAYHRFGASLESGDIARAEQMLARLRELIPQLRQPYFNWVTSLAGAMLGVMRAAPDAEQQVSAAFELGRAGGQPDANMVYFAQLSVVRRDQGRFGELVEPLRQTVQAQPHLPVWAATLAGLYCETDQFDQARAQVAILAAKGFDLPVDWTWPSAVMSLAQVASDLGDRALAEHFYLRLQKVAGQLGVTGIGLICYGSYALPCGLLAACLQRWDEADRYFGEAEAMNERIGARPYLVRTRRAWAAMLIDRNAPGDRARIDALMAAASGAAVELGMQREIVRLERLRERMSMSSR